MDGDGADDPSAIEGMVAAIRSGGYDFVIGSRARGKREEGSMAGHQILAGIVAGGADRLLYGVRYTDMCALSRHSPHYPACARHARNDLWLESRNADARRARRDCACWNCRSTIAAAAAGDPKWPAACAAASRLGAHHRDIRSRRDGAEARTHA